MMEERTLVIDREGDRMIGVLHEAAAGEGTGIVIVVGGPQYRVGSHRQFILMARRIAAAGIPVLRFDVRGMGDSEGQPRSFDRLDSDIRAAMDAFAFALPSVTRIVLLGLCDAASAILIYGYTDSRVRGLILLNPWVRTTQGEAQTYLRHYYLQRVLQKSFWRKLLSGGVAAGRSARQFFQVLQESKKRRLPDSMQNTDSPANFIDRMLYGWQQFQYPILLVISGRDLTAKEFMDRCNDDRGWRKLRERKGCSVRQLPEADHTMSDRNSLELAIQSCLEWVTETR